MSAIRALGRVCCRGERGQVLFLFVGVFTVFLFMAAVVIDFGLWFSERRDVQRAADFAALAGAQDLLVDDLAAQNNAFGWAARNGFQDDVGGVEVEVTLRCRNNLSSPPEGICYNPNSPGVSDCNPGDGCDAISVTISKPAPHLFTQLFGVNSIAVTSGAAAVAGIDLDVQELDTMILLQDRSSMRFPSPPCNADPALDSAGCPRKEAKDAAHAFVNILVDPEVVTSQVGYIPYTQCYGPTWPCIPDASVLGLTSDPDGLHAGIDATWLSGLSGATNICVPLLRARQMLISPQAQPGPGVRRAIVLLSDGENVFTGALAQGPCWAVNPSGSTDPNEECPAWNQPSGRPERDFDLKAYQQAEQWLKPQGVEIYVVGLNVCGADDGRTQATPGYCAGIGDTAHDNVANQRLLKCVASAPDHYVSVSTASELPVVFQRVAGRIAGRGLLQ